MNIITSQDIAKKFGVTHRTAECYLAPNSKLNTKTAIAMRDYAKSIGYYSPDGKCDKCGNIFQRKNRQQHLCPACYAFMKKKIWKHGTNKKFYHNGCFHSKDEETERMLSLRDEGYSNKEIAEKIGRDYTTVLKTIGYQSKELTKKNQMLGKRICAQKNALRKQFVTNKKISEYNKKVAEFKEKQNELELLRTEISKDTKRVTKLSNKKIKCPEMSIEILKVSAM